jgi:predicted O-linked N-acetylglucosamine transferase (SPINDLY family)
MAIRNERMDMIVEFNGITRYSMAKSLAHRLAPIRLWLCELPSKARRRRRAGSS